MFSLGQRIRELRIKKGLAQTELAKDLCTPSMISQIESDRARPSYKILFAIADRLEVPLEKLLSDVDMNLEYISSYKMARAMVAAKEYASAIPLLVELLEMPRTQISTLDILYELGECYLHTGVIEMAEKTYQQVAETAVLRQDHQMLAQVYKNIGLIECRRNQYVLAAYQWQKALEEVEKMTEQDAYLKANLFFLMGRVHIKLGKIAPALDHFNQASILFGDNPFEIGKVYLELGISYRRINDYEKAAEYSDRALSILEGMENIMATLQLQVLKAAIFVETGRQEEAEELLHSAISKYREYGKRTEEGIALVELAKSRFKLGDLKTTEEFCRQARVILPEIHLYQAWVHRILGRVAVEQNNMTEALRRLQQAADCFKMLQELKEWDATMYEIAKLHRDKNDLSQAIDVLESMRSFTNTMMESRGLAL